MMDRYDHRGRLLDGPDDPSAEACVQHGNSIETCQQCRADFEREMATEEAWARKHLPPPDALDGIEDLPF